ncbi:MAG TPA: hypothetical protein VKB95_01525 [Chitinophagaceae bacterium]|nr:hypothetical protein [Chitinophagaceae bacterium]
MKKLVLTLITSLFFVSIFAQRVDLDRFNFTASYRDFPNEPLPNEYKTYNVRIEAAPSLGLGYSAANLENLVNIEGLKKVNGTGHITILAILDDIVVEKTETKERVQITKDKQNLEIRKSFFSNEMTYSFSARATVYDYKGNTVVSNYILFERENKRTYKTPEFSSPEDAATNFNNKILETKSNLAKQLVNGAVSNLNSYLNASYGYSIQKVNDIFWVLNNKKHPEYGEQQKAWNNFKNAIVLMNPDEPLDKVKEKLRPVIAYYDKVKTIYTGSDKEARKLRYASYYNLAKIYLYLDDPASAMREADALAMNDYDESDGRNLRAVAESLDEQLKKNNASTRHFPVVISNFQPPVK